MSLVRKGRKVTFWQRHKLRARNKSPALAFLIFCKLLEVETKSNQKSFLIRQ